MDQDAQRADALVVAHPVLLAADPPHRHRVHELEVRRVEGERQVELMPRLGRPIAGVAEVVLHVATPAVHLRVLVLELAEDRARVLAHDVREHVQAAPVRHAEHDLVHPLGAGLLERQVEQRDQALRTLQREALRPDELLLDELLEDDGVGQLGQDAQLGGPGQLEAVAGALHARLQPAAHLEVVDVHELRADRARVRRAQRLVDVADGPGVVEGRVQHRPPEVRVRDPVVAEFQFRDVDLVPAQRVQVSDPVPAHAEVAHEPVEPLVELGVRRPAALHGRGGRRRREERAAAEPGTRAGATREARSRCTVGPHAIELRAPGIGHRVGVPEVFEVEVLDVPEAGGVHELGGVVHAVLTPMRHDAGSAMAAVGDRGWVGRRRTSSAAIAELGHLYHAASPRPRASTPSGAGPWPSAHGRPTA